jgi:hypothetical protein
MLAATCPHCHYELRLVDSLQGKVVSCSKCKGEFVLQHAAPAGELPIPVKVASPPPIVPWWQFDPSAPLPFSPARAVRVLVWASCFIACWYSSCNYSAAVSRRYDFRRDAYVEADAIQQSGAAGEALVGIATACGMALAVDRLTRR